MLFSYITDILYILLEQKKTKIAFHRNIDNQNREFYFYKIYKCIKQKIIYIIYKLCRIVISKRLNSVTQSFMNQLRKN